MAATASAAPLYRWTDASGEVVYADQPPPEPPPGGIDVVLDTVPTHDPEPLRPAYEPPEPDPEPPEHRGEPPPEPEEPYTCEEARAYASIHAPRGGDERRLYVPGDDGTFERLAPEQVAGMHAAWRAVEARVCPSAEVQGEG